MLVTTFIMQLKETICNLNCLYELSGDIQFNKYGKNFDLKLFSSSLSMSNIIFNFDNPRDMSKYRKDCLVVFKQFMIENNKEYVAGQTKYITIIDIDNQLAYIKFLNLITTNETLSQEFDKCLKDNKFNPFLSNTTKKSGQRFRKLDLLQHDVLISKKHNMNEFNQKFEICKEKGASSVVKIDRRAFKKIDISEFLGAELINVGISGQPGSLTKDNDSGSNNPPLGSNNFPPPPPPVSDNPPLGSDNLPPPPPPPVSDNPPLGSDNLPPPPPPPENDNPPLGSDNLPPPPPPPENDNPPLGSDNLPPPPPEL